MNIYQRIILIVGAIALIAVLVTVPYVVNIKGTLIRYIPEEHSNMLYSHIDYGLAFLRSLAVIGVTLLLFFAAKGIKKTTFSGRPNLSIRQAINKIIERLKPYFTRRAILRSIIIIGLIVTVIGVYSIYRDAQKNEADKLLVLQKEIELKKIQEERNQRDAELKLLEEKRIQAETDKQKQFNSWFFKGEDLLRKKKYQKAIDAFTAAIEIDPEHASAHQGRGYAYLEARNIQQAIQDYDRAIEIDKQNASSYFFRGIAYISLKNYPKAIVDFDRAILIDPKYADCYYFRGYSYYELENKTEGLRNMKIAAELGDKNALQFLKLLGIK